MIQISDVLQPQPSRIVTSRPHMFYYVIYDITFALPNSSLERYCVSNITLTVYPTGTEIKQEPKSSTVSHDGTGLKNQCQI